MDHEAMISWLPRSTFQSLSCPPATIEARKTYMVSSPSPFCNWVAGYLTQFSTMRSKGKNDPKMLRMLIISLVEDKGGGSSLLTGPSSCLCMWLWYLELLKLWGVKRGNPEKLSQNPSRAKLLNQYHLPSHLLLVTWKKQTPHCVDPWYLAFPF